MRLASFQQGKRTGFGVVEGEVIIDLAPQFPNLTLRALLADPKRLSDASGRGTRVLIEAVEWLPPIPDPPRIYCVGRNFKRAMARVGLEHPAYPILFARFATSQAGHRQPIIRPKVSQQFDYEGEVCVVIGREGHHIAEAQALDHVAGYTCYNDGSVRDYQRHTAQDTPGKNFWRSGAAGPWVVTSDEIPDPAALSVQTTVNGEVVQADRLDDLLFSVPKVLAYLSSIAPLESGTLIAMGTPFGAGINLTPPRWLKPGDEVSVTVNGIGTLTNNVVDEAEFTSSR